MELAAARDTLAEILDLVRGIMETVATSKDQVSLSRSM